MKNRLYCSRGPSPQVIKNHFICFLIAVCLLLCAPSSQASDAPQWMHALVNAPLPAHDEKTDAVLMYSERIVAVQSTDRIKTTVRRAYKILRPGGREAGYAA